MLENKQLIDTEDLKGMVNDIANVFAQYRSASQQINKDHERILNEAITILNQEHDKILEELKTTKLEAKSDVTEAIKNALAQCKQMCDEVMAMKPKDGEKGEDADEEYIIEELAKRIPQMPEIPDLEEYDKTVESRLEEIKKHIKKSINGFPGVRLLSALMDTNISNPTNGQVLKYNSTTNKWENGVGGGSATIYVETPNEAIDGVETAFTVDNTITTVISIHINGQFIHPADYSVAGDTITFGVAPDAALAGLPFTVVYT